MDGGRWDKGMGEVGLGICSGWPHRVGNVHRGGLHAKWETCPQTAAEICALECMRMGDLPLGLLSGFGHQKCRDLSIV